MKIEEIFYTSKINEADDQQIEETLKKYVKERMPFLEYIDSRKSYATRRFEFKILDPDFVNPKFEKTFARNLDIILAAVKCQAFAYRDRMIVNVPRDDKDTLYLGDGLREFMEEEKAPVRCYVGECDDGSAATIDFTDIPHLIIGGTTGSGKSVCMSNIILTLAAKYTPEEVQFYIIDDKNELGVFKDLPHVKRAAFNRKEITDVLEELFDVYETRKELKQGYNSIDAYNQDQPDDKKLPHIFVLFDEADSVLRRDSSDSATASKSRTIIQEICAEARSSGIHVILGSQKPSQKNIDTTIKANIPGRIALQVVNSVDSRVILDEKGAEQLTGNGDALLKMNSQMKRIQCALTTPEEQKRAVDLLKNLY